MQERGDALRRAVRLGLLAMVVGAGPVLAADATFEVGDFRGRCVNQLLRLSHIENRIDPVLLQRLRQLQ